MAILDLGKVVPEKGVDYFTQSDINSFIDDVKTELKVSDLQNDAGYITKDVNNLTYYYTKTEVDGKVSSVYKYKGSVATYSDLPSTELTVGDVYNVESDGSNYAWNGTLWDKLGGDIDLSGYQTKIDSTHKLSAELVDDTNGTNKFTNTTEKSAWSAKYDKPTNGIPKSDLSTEVQISLGKADTALQSETYTGTITSVKMNGTTIANSGEADLGTVITQHQDISGKLDTSAVKTTHNTTAGNVYDVTYINSILGDINTALASLVSVGGN